ncbi:MAG TPA: sulfate ABC transporter substrate-binding protein [Pyrinomonadaceae bacterium]|nr:sulfate ABC transporter substrate-binding protein [Pyrinomonadaceae bacterium]
MAVIVKNNVLVRRLQEALPLVFMAALALYAIWPWLPLRGRTAKTHTIIFYGFSILAESMNQRIFPAFQEEWQAASGDSIEFVSSFAGSGTITNQIIMGVPADIGLLPLEMDANRIAASGITTSRSWQELPHRGVVNLTPFIILVRPGNPKNIRDFSDLVRPGVQVVHPDPLTSGGANWAIVAVYGAGMRQNPGNPNAGYDLLLGVWRNVVAQASSARAARTQFENGFGDALITYEQEVLWDQSRGRLRGEIVYPRSTILSEHMVMAIERNIEPEEREIVNSFVQFLWSKTAQRIFVEYGFRSVDEQMNAGNPAFGKIADPFLIEDFGGWQRAKPEIVDAIWKEHVLKEMER